MPFDAPRKTLDEIRCEIDADYPLSLTPRDNAPPLDNAPPVVVRLPAPVKSRSRYGYLVAGIVGCALSQLVFFGLLSLTRSGWTVKTSAVSTSITAATAPTPTMPLASSASTSPKAAPAASAAPPPTVVAPLPVVSSPPPRSFSAPMALPAPVATERKTLHRRVGKPAGVVSQPKPMLTAVPSEAASPITDSEDEVRAAFGAWLIASGLGDRRTVAETAVFLSADGQTARTHVRANSAFGPVIREQRWRREANGWSMVDGGDGGS